MKAMKFVLKARCSSNGRKGVISGIYSKPDLHIDTPALMFYTKGASIPHLTHEVLEMLTQEKLILQIPLVSTLKMSAGVKAKGEGILNFAGMDEHLSFTTFHDPSVDTRMGKFETDKMPLWTRTGKLDFNADMYMDVVECFKPDFYSVLSDNCTDDDSSKKRISKSVDRSEIMLERCIDRHKKSEYLQKNSSIFGVIVGGNNLHERKRFLKTINKYSDDLDGFILDGIDHNSSLLQNKSYESIKDIVECVTSNLPEDKVRVVQGCWNPVTVLDLVQNGWDLFDTTLPTIYTDKGICLTFNFDFATKSDSVFAIDVTEKRFKDDFSPVLEKCECLTCRKYSKAYIHHLLNTKELLANVLMMIHNLHHYIKYFEVIKTIATTEDMLKLRNIVSVQFNKYLEKKDDGEKISIERIKARKLSVDEPIQKSASDEVMQI